MFVMTVTALGAVLALVWTVVRRQHAGRHLRSPLGPVRGDGSGWTQEGLGTPPAGPRGPEDDPEFMAHLDRMRRPKPPSEA